MKNIYLIALSALLVINLVVGFCFKDYKMYNMIWSSGVIVANIVIMYLTFSSKLKDGFYYSLAIVMPIFFLIEIMMALKLVESSGVQVALLLIVILAESLTAYIANVISKKNY